MKDLIQRRTLAQQLRWLVTGRITNDAFDDFLFDEGVYDSKDKTVAEITRWASTLYSDTHTYRLQGCDALKKQERAAAVRSIVLLRSGEDYRWPCNDPPWAVELAEMIGWFCVPMGVALAIIAILLGINDVRWVGNDSGMIVVIGWLSVAFTLWSVASYTSRELRRPLEEAFNAAGDVEYWPFLSQQDLAHAAQRGHLLAPTPPAPHA